MRERGKNAARKTFPQLCETGPLAVGFAKVSVILQGMAHEAAFLDAVRRLFLEGRQLARLSNNAGDLDIGLGAAKPKPEAKVEGAPGQGLDANESRKSRPRTRRERESAWTSFP
jgi:hypothetical protein